MKCMRSLCFRCQYYFWQCTYKRPLVVNASNICRTIISHLVHFSEVILVIELLLPYIYILLLFQCLFL
ncbi:hypothetical protein AQUCO_01600443v1 [Aquilegia coerulea]|uniref:Uncharacterized protein n=1 Tax=Aquilegia coerulea TaxID=218851 RepID=A0A2G5DRM5_AQUCA|nr:hypothetical protein AQUCO_01600443v1 [Aquilegia coerulea]